jgi:hypothetical protein
MTWGRAQEEAGEIGGLDALVFGTAAFVVALLAWASAWRVLDAAQAASSAANAGLAQALQADGTRQARRVATATATEVLRTYGYAGAHPTVTLHGHLARCARIEVSVRAAVPLVRLPLISAPATIEVQGRAGGLVDPFAPGLEGTDRCG